jgi:predicted phosphohydrolase
MRILVTADLHYDIARSRGPARELARRAVEKGGDALVLVGDTAGAELAPLQECLRLFEGFAGRRLFVPGNHCLWCLPGQDSLDRYERILPKACEEAGFEFLDRRPVVMGARRRDGRRTVGPRRGVLGPGAVGLAGSIGWYDYSFADASLEMPEDFYRAKVAPGAAEYLGGHETILERHRHRLTERHRGMGVQWMDGVNVRLGMSDEEFLWLLCGRLRAQLADLSGQCERIVVFTHHLPFGDLVPSGRPDRFAFAAAFLGAGALGDVIREFPKVTHVYCGHSHWRGRTQVGQVAVVNVGSTYTRKRLEVLEL